MGRSDPHSGHPSGVTDAVAPADPAGHGPPGIAALLAPRSVAIVGASPRVEALGGRPLLNLRRQGYAGAIYPVNPRYEEIQRARCYPDLLSLPEPPDAVLVLVGADRVFATLDQAAEIGARAAIVFGGGFAEAGAAGAARQAQLAGYAARGLRICGPNCNGVFNVARGVAMGFSPAFELPARRGRVALVSQSGNVATNTASRGMEMGVGFSHIVASGNEADLEVADFVEHLLDDPDVGVFALFVEGFKDAPRFLRVAEAALRRGKPIVALKIGRSASGQRMALSHTGAMTGAWQVVTTALRQKGVVVARELDELWGLASLFAMGRRPTGARGLAVASLSGGMAGMIADASEEHGVRIPPLAPHTAEALETALPGTASLGNPLDVTGQVVNEPESWSRCLRALERDPGVDAVLSVLSITAGQAERRFAEDLVAIARDSSALHACLWPSATPPGSGFAVLRDAGLPVFTRTDEAVGALAAWYHYWGTRDARLAALDEARPPAAPAGFAESGWELLRQAGIPVVRQQRVDSPAALEAALGALRFPVALKAEAAALAHKTERGALRLGLRSAAEALAAFDELSAALADVPDLAFVVQEMADGRRELILGLKREPGLGMAVMIGLGGVFSEALRDVAIRVAPLTPLDAEEMVQELRGRAILGGARGLGPARPEMITDLLLGLSGLAERYAERIEELDVNPLILADDGASCAAVDVLVRWRDPEG